MNCQRLLLSAFVLTGSFLTSCHTAIQIRTKQPGPVAIGSTNQLVLLKGEGRRSAREQVANNLIQQCRANGYFSVTDHSEDPFFVKVAGGRVHFDGRSPVQEQQQAGLRIDVLEWNSTRETIEVKQHNPKTGRTVFRQVPVRRGNALIAVTLFDAEGRAWLAEREYNGSAETQDMDMAREEIVEHAARQAITEFLADITPRDVVASVRMDESDPSQEHIINTAKAGNLAKATEDLRAYNKAQPNNPAAIYNLAVMLDAMGDYQEALETYDRAIRISSKDYYNAARGDCARRLSDNASLSAPR